jgi:hypothetical protein
MGKHYEVADILGEYAINPNMDMSQMQMKSQHCHHLRLNCCFCFGKVLAWI